MENLKKEIEQLKQEKNAVLLAHYYVDDAVQEIADYVGDSYYLAKVALKESKDVICFAGVNFMGESAKILNPDRTVIMPDQKADCPMAHMVDVERRLKRCVRNMMILLLSVTLILQQRSKHILMSV